MKINLTQKEKYVFEHFRQIFSYVFQTLLFLFLIALLIKEFYPDFVNSRININWFMLAVIIFGALSILFPPKHKKQEEQEKEVTWKDKVMIIALGILGAIIIFLKLRNLGWIGYVIAGLGGLIIILLSWLILTEKDEEKENEKD